MVSRSATSPSARGRQEDLTTEAFHDSLTGLANRQLFFDRVDDALTRREAQPWRPLAVSSLDLDDFTHRRCA